MNAIAKIISILIAIKGLFLLIFPGYTRNFAQYFTQVPDKYKRILGGVWFLIGLLFLYFTRTELLTPFLHWFISVAGIYFMLTGLIIVVFPPVIGKVAVWFYSEKGPTSLTGFILFVGGIVLFVLL